MMEELAEQGDVEAAEREQKAEEPSMPIDSSDVIMGDAL